jgi:pimeloyl-ACP methyl ester carboxylesterase
MPDSRVQTGYAPVNGLNIYYEIHGAGQPLVLLHGAFSGIGTSFGATLPGLAASRQVIAFELQGHGRTADIDRPLSTGQMAEDVAAALRYLGFEQVDVLGYSMGGDVALHLVTGYPELVRKLVLMSATYNRSGVHPGLMDGFAEMKPEMMVGSPFHDEYMRIAPHPENFAALFAKKTQMDQEYEGWPAEMIAAIQAPTLLIIGDSDLTRPEHAVEMFRLLGGGVFGDLPAGLPDSQLAVIPGASHVSIAGKTDVLLAIIPPFLDLPMPDAS